MRMQIVALNSSVRIRGNKWFKSFSGLLKMSLVSSNNLANGGIEVLFPEDGKSGGLHLSALLINHTDAALFEKSICM